MEKKKRKRFSYLWEYFTIKDSVNGVASCNTCDRRLSYKSTLTNLRKHLDTMHPNSLPDRKQNVTDASSAASSPVCTIVDVSGQDNQDHIYTSPQVDEYQAHEPPKVIRTYSVKDSTNESEANASTPVVADSGTTPPVSTSRASSSSVGSKRKWRESKDDEIQTIANEPLSLPLNGNDEFDLLGMGIATKMRKISKINNIQCIIAERLISEVIYHAQLQSLTFDTVIQDSENRVN